MGTKPIVKADPPAQGDAQQILDSIRRIVRELRVSARAAEAKVGLSGAQLFVLSRLSEEKRLSLGDLAARTLTDPSSVSVVVAKLVDGGLVTRKRSAEDERRVELAISPAGRALLRKAPAAAQDRLVAAVGALGAGPRRTLSRLLDEVVRGMGLDDTEAHVFFEDEKRALRASTVDGAAGGPRPRRAARAAGLDGSASGSKPRRAARSEAVTAPARASRAASGGLTRASPRAHEHGRSQ